MNAPAEIIAQQINDVSVMAADLADGFECGPFTGNVSEMIALGAMPCPGCGTYVHADRIKRGVAA